jgi:hypothetical protein
VLRLFYRCGSEFEWRVTAYSEPEAFYDGQKFCVYRHVWDVDVWRDNHLLNFCTNIYRRYTEYTDELQMKNCRLPFAGCRSQVGWWKKISWIGLSESESESESYVTTDGQSASLSWNKAPIWGLRGDFYYCRIIAGLLKWGALSDERTGLSFTIAAGFRQRSHSRVRVP